MAKRHCFKKLMKTIWKINVCCCQKTPTGKPLKTQCFPFLAWQKTPTAKSHPETNENPLKTKWFPIPALDGSPQPHPQNVWKALVFTAQMATARKLRNRKFIVCGSAKLIPFHVIGGLRYLETIKTKWYKNYWFSCGFWGTSNHKTN